MAANSFFDALEELNVLIDNIRQSPVSAKLLKSVAQNPSAQTVDLQMSCTSVDIALSEFDDATIALASNDMTTLLRKLVAFSKQVYPHNDGSRGELEMWLYENSTRLKKICIVRKIMSYRTLAAFIGSGGPVRQKPLSIPVWLIEAWLLILSFEEHAEARVAKQYIENTLIKVDVDFLALVAGEGARKVAQVDAEEFIQKHKRARTTTDIDK